MMVTVLRRWTTLLSFFLVGTLLTPPLPARGDNLEPEDSLARFADRLLLGGKNLQQAPRRGVLAKNMALVGQVQTTNSPPATAGYTGPTTGFNGDVFVHAALSGSAAGKPFAYVGQWGRRLASNVTTFCPGAAIKIVDLSDPAAPVQVTRAARAGHAGTTSEDAEVRRVATASGTIDLLATGLQRCTNEGLAGADFWDVSDPTNPVFLSFFDVGGNDFTGAPVCLDANNRPAVRGVHELHLFQKGSRVYALLAAIFREATIAGGVTEVNCGPEFIVVDVTDPTTPTRVADWGINRDLGLDPTQGLLDRKPNQGDFSRRFLHSVNTTPDRSKALLSYWDFGAAILNISALASAPGPPQTLFVPPFLGTTLFPVGDEGNAHSAEPAVVNGVPLVLQADEDFVGPPWGYLRIFDISDPSNPVEIGTFQTPHSQGGAPEEEVGAFSIHIPVVKGTKAAVSWYSDGIRVLDISNPAAPVEEGFLVPAPAPDPFGLFPNNALVWGATFADINGQEYIVASDLNFGLYVMRQTE